MGQIIINYIFIFVAPFLAGAALRLLCRRAKRGYLITLVSIALAVVGWAAFYTIPSHGSEVYGIIALQLTSMAAGVLLAGLTIQLRQRK